MARSTAAGPGRVAVLERAVVAVVDVARLVLPLEVGERGEEEPPLVLQPRQPSGSVTGRSRSADPSRSRSAARRPARGRPPSAAPASEARRQRRKATTSPAAHATSRATGSTHTRASMPLVLGHQQHVIAIAGGEAGADLVVGLAGADQSGDLRLDVERHAVAALVHALRRADRALDRPRDGVDALLRRAGTARPRRRRPPAP